MRVNYKSPIWIGDFILRQVVRILFGSVVSMLIYAVVMIFIHVKGALLVATALFILWLIGVMSSFLLDTWDMFE